MTKNGPRGLRSLQRDRGRPYKCDSPGVVKSAITIGKDDKCVEGDILPMCYSYFEVIV